MTGRDEQTGDDLTDIGDVAQIEVAVGDGVRRPVRLAVALIAVALAGGLSLVWLLGSSGDDREGLSPASASSSTSEATPATTGVQESTAVDSTVADTTVAAVATSDVAGGRTRVPPPGSLLEWCLDRMASPPLGWSGCQLDQSACQSVLMGPVVLTMPDMHGWSRSKVGEWVSLVSVIYPFCTLGPIPISRVPLTPDTCTLDTSLVDRLASQSVAPGTKVTGVSLVYEFSYYALCVDPPPTSGAAPSTAPTPTEAVPSTEG